MRLPSAVASEISRLLRALGRANKPGVSTPVIKGAESAQAAEAARRAVQADPSIQFQPLPPPPPPPPIPGWLKALGEFLRNLFEPIGQALGMSWPVMQWLLVALAVGAVGLILWRIAQRVIDNRRVQADSAVDTGWAPEREEAEALLADADRLASEGRFDEATHLLLMRSVQQIARARPDWVRPHSTAREIAANPLLPRAASQAFALIAGRVERSLFALRPLGQTDWSAARAAYADFALERLPSGVAA